MSESVTPAVLDRAALDGLLEMTGGDPEFMAEMIDTFLVDSPPLVAEIETAAAMGNTAVLQRAAHTLKSNSRTFGVTVLGDLSQQIEERAASGKLDDVPDLIRRLQAEYPAAATALNAERPRS